MLIRVSEFQYMGTSLPALLGGGAAPSSQNKPQGANTDPVHTQCTGPVKGQTGDQAQSAWAYEW